MKKTLLICATALLVASCSKDTTETPEVPEVKPQGIIFSAAQDDDVRTKLDGVNILWQRGDAVGIFSDEIPEAANYKAVITEADHDKQFATLRTDLNYNGSGEHTFYAYYPYVEGSDYLTVNGSISVSQNGEIGSNAFMWATATVDPAANQRVDLHFKHPFTYLNIQLRATGEYQGATVEQIRLEAAEDKTLAGDFEAYLSIGSVYFKTHAPVVTVTPAAAALGTDYLNTFVVVAPVDLTDSRLTVIVTLRQNGNVVKLRTVKAGRQLNPQTKVNLKLTAEEMDIVPSDDAITFADDAVKAICLERWDTNQDGSLSYKEAAEVQRLDGAFVGNGGGNGGRSTGISSFDELQYFKGLTSIHGEFYGCSNLKSIKIPNNVMSIEGAFVECSSLTSIVIPNNVTLIEAAFFGCSSLTNVVISENVTSIGGSTFSGCSSLDNIVIPDNVTSIGNSAFNGCSSLTSIVIPDKVTTLGSDAFAGCKRLTDVTIGNGIETIPDYCFSSCTSLENIVIPNNVTSIGNSAFEGCSSLTSIVIPDKVTTLGSRAFFGCNKLTDLTIGNGIKTIPEYCFYGCSLLTSIVIPETVTSIGESAFSGCSILDNIALPNNVTSIGNSAFYECSSLANIALPNNLTSIGDYAFYDCVSLTSIAIPDKVTTLGNSVFIGCDRLTDVTIGNGIETIPDYCFSSCTSLENIVIPNNVTSIGSAAFIACVNLVDIVISENVTSIGSEAFNNCTGLERITLPDKISEIGERVFNGCVSLKTFNGKYASEDHRCLIRNGELIAFAPASLKEYAIPESVTSIGSDVFTDCEELENITIPDGVTEIKDYTFETCTSITSVTISKNVTMIGENAFYKCPLTDVYCRASTPPTCGYRAFGKVTNTINLYVPTESVNLYTAKATWKNFGQIIGYNFGNL